MTWYRRLTTSILLASLLSGLPLPSGAADDTMMNAMKRELMRSFAQLKNAGREPLYFLAYRVYDNEYVDIDASFGAIESRSCPSHSRQLQIELRVGNPKIDNTHKMRGGGYYSSGGGGSDLEYASLPLDDNPDCIAVALWAKTDSAFKQAQDRYARLQANKDVKVEEEDTSDDFSQERPQAFIDKKTPALGVDVPVWEDRLRRLSAIFKSHPKIESGTVKLTANRKKRYLATSEGTEIEDTTTNYRLDVFASAVSDDGMKVQLYDYAEALQLSDIPDEDKLHTMVEKLADNVDALRVAPTAEPYAGPAILRARAAGVFFHEILGHRLEGHRQRDEGEGRTFAKKLGQKILPDIISLIDDPTTDHWGQTKLVGNYKFDDEGVPAQKVVLVDHGVLTGFLMGREPVNGFPRSNGHGRAEPGRDPVARQGNLIVWPAKRVSYAELRQLLIAEIRKQHKPYGLIFDEISGGFTMTSVHLPQVFELKPLSVTRVWADGRPDELLRGVNLIGTPLASLETILAAADDDDTFNGTCGAESGWVKVSAVSPSLLVQNIEVERHEKAQEKQPILPPPTEEKIQLPQAQGGSN